MEWLARRHQTLNRREAALWPLGAGECAMTFPVVAGLSSPDLMPLSFNSDGRVLSRDA
jgi:hypothetical protein